MAPRVSLFGRQLILSILITSVFVLTLGYLSIQTLRQIRSETPYSPPSVTFGKLLHGVPKEKRVDVLKEIADKEEPASRFQFWLVTKEGKVLFPEDEQTPPVDWQAALSEVKARGPRTFTVIQVDENEEQYLVVKVLSRNNNRRTLWTNLSFALVAVVLGTTISLTILFYSLRKKARLADEVISELQKGNLKARFPVNTMDEVGEAMLRFNKMADEIERLVERLKSTEKSRMALLQELAHDLRTPVASLKNMLETLSRPDSSIQPEVKSEFLALSLKEVDYFEHLVEDLLFLAQATEPSYNQTAQTVDLVELIESEIESTEKSNPLGEGRISFSKDFSVKLKTIKGDGHLLRRLFRNALDNAASYAKNNIKVTLRNNDRAHIECIVEDDGPGFTDQTLKEYGRRKYSRQFNSDSQRRASIGLGSVIMSTVANLHRGEVVAGNHTDDSGKILGAQIKIILPL